MNILTKIFTVFFLLAACNNVPVDLPKINIKNFLNTTAANAFEQKTDITKFSFCNSIPYTNWDKIAVIAPYMQEKNLKDLAIINYDAIKDTILSVNVNDSKCVLLFIKKNKGVAYSITDRMPIDFANLSNDVIVLEKVHCNKMLLSKSDDKQYFKVQIDSL